MTRGPWVGSLALSASRPRARSSRRGRSRTRAPDWIVGQGGVWYGRHVLVHPPCAAAPVAAGGEKGTRMTYLVPDPGLFSPRVLARMPRAAALLAALVLIF